MFDTETMIHEVRKREELWKKIHPDYSNSHIRQTKWEEIGQVLYHSWNNYKSPIQETKVKEIIKKWRNVRDYYNKEKKRQNKEASMLNSGATKRKRLYNYFNILSFLDDAKNPDSQLSENGDNQETIVYSDNDTDSFHSDGVEEEQCLEETIEFKTEIPIVKRQRKESITPSQRCLLSSITRPQDNTTAVKNFLLSLIPDVATLSDHQFMQFRLSILNLLNTMKFTDSAHESWVISTIDNTN